MTQNISRHKSVFFTIKLLDLHFFNTNLYWDWKTKLYNFVKKYDEKRKYTKHINVLFNHSILSLLVFENYVINKLNFKVPIKIILGYAYLGTYIYILRFMIFVPFCMNIFTEYILSDLEMLYENYIRAKLRLNI